ncbi:MAG: 1-phosphofructokinase [Candidatus Brocadiales bacterium]
MIYTLTLNPALDRTLSVEGIKFDDPNRITRETRYAGGKGIDVSRAIKELGGHSVAIGFIGGFNGLELQGHLINEGITCDFIRIADETRTNVVIRDETSGRQMLFSAPGPQVRPQDVAAVYNKLSNLSPPPTFVVMSGSLPRGITPNIYAQLIKAVKEQGGKTVLDTDNEPLRLGIEELPFLIKPNVHELSRLVGKNLEDIRDIAAEARELNKRGIEVVVVTMGPRGLIIVGKELGLHCKTPDVKVMSTIGAGDSTVGGLVLSLAQGKSLREAAVVATSAGTGAIICPESGLCRREDVERFLGQIEVEEL